MDMAFLLLFLTSSLLLAELFRKKEYEIKRVMVRFQNRFKQHFKNRFCSKTNFFKGL
jgi:hypothetical protein